MLPCSKFSAGQFSYPTMLSTSALFTLTLFFLVICGQSAEPALLSNRVLGTIATLCGQIPYHTRPNQPYPTENPKDTWIPGSESICLHDLNEVLAYCRQLYGPASVKRAIPNPFLLTNNTRPPYSQPLLSSVQVYLCLGTPSSSPKGIGVDLVPSPEIQQTTLTPTSHHLPSLIDVHRAYFDDKFRQLTNQTKANVTKVIDHLRQNTEGLAKLYRSDAKLAQYTASRLLQDAHKRLDQIWSQEASEWSRLEQARHEDLVKQLDSEDWAGENEFAYVLQEFTLDLDRVQDALSNLLNRLADSVVEEVRHLRLVESHQPWGLASKHTNWTNHITREFTNIERVHEVLLKYVETATRAINTVRSLMVKNSANYAESDRPHLDYKPAVLDSYNRLQSELFTAESVLSEAKHILVANVTNRMHSLFQQLHLNLQPGNNQTAISNVSDAYIMEWLRSTHHSELAFIDLLVSRIVDHPVSSSTDYSSDPLWRPAPDAFILKDPIMTPNTNVVVVTAPSPALAKMTLHTILIMAASALFCLFLTLGLFILCLALRSRKTTNGRGDRSDPSLMTLGKRRLKYLARRSGLFGGHAALGAHTPTWKVERRVVVVNGGGRPSVKLGDPTHMEPPAEPESRGYANPIHPSC